MLTGIVAEGAIVSEFLSGETGERFSGHLMDIGRLSFDDKKPPIFMGS